MPRPVLFVALSIKSQFFLLQIWHTLQVYVDDTSIAVFACLPVKKGSKFLARDLAAEALYELDES